MDVYILKEWETDENNYSITLCYDPHATKDEAIYTVAYEYKGYAQASDGFNDIEEAIEFVRDEYGYMIGEE